jgi:hypothetical protein
MKKLKRSRTEREKGRKGEREIFSFFRPLFFCSVISLVLLSFGCQPNQTILKDAPPPPTPMSTAETKKTSFEQDLRDMQTANFDYIFVFRRRDGGTFDSDDRKYLRQNTPPETNRWTSTDEGRAFIAGSGFGFTPENMTALQERFIVEDYSKPEIREAANKAADPNANKPAANSNKNANKPGANSNNAEKLPVNKKEK